MSSPISVQKIPTLGTRDKNVGWYQPMLEKTTDAQRELFENYGHIAPHDVISHILEVRERAWEIHPYPCIGQLRFIDLSLSRTPSYPSILKCLQEGASLLDLGCCFAQDLRKLIYDGALAANLWGVDLKQEFLDLGYELFLDRQAFGAYLAQADLFDQEGSIIKQLEGNMSIIQIGHFLHLFELEKQYKACEKIAALLKPEKGVLIVGQQIGKVEAGRMLVGGGSMMYKA